MKTKRKIRGNYSGGKTTAGARKLSTREKLLQLKVRRRSARACSLMALRQKEET